MMAKIVLRYDSTRIANAIAQAISPDNETVPVGLKIKTLGNGRSIVTSITCSTRLETLMYTVDDLLSSVQIAERSIKSLAG